MDVRANVDQDGVDQPAFVEFFRDPEDEFFGR